MNNIILQLCLLFGYIALGFFCNKLGILDSTSDKYLSGFLLKVTLPASIMASAIGQDTANKGQAFYVLAIAAGIFILKPILALIFQKFTKCDDLYKLMLTYPNLGFMGFPIISAMYGQLGVFYASLFMIIFNLSVFSYGVSTINQESALQLEKLVNPGIISSILAILIFAFSIPVPEVITQFLSKLGGVTSPLAMITLGSTLAAVSFKSLIKDKFLYLFTVCKLIVWPFIFWFVLHFFVHDPMVLGLCTILISLPVAGNVSMLCITYDGDTDLAARGTCISTLLSLITIPVYMFLFTV
jgi:predicted permease